MPYTEGVPWPVRMAPTGDDPVGSAIDRIANSPGARERLRAIADAISVLETPEDHEYYNTMVFINERVEAATGLDAESFYPSILERFHDDLDMLDDWYFELRTDLSLVDTQVAFLQVIAGLAGLTDQSSP
ncbi:hypothetical protein [Antribacter gilvus]|uniref:hypothetical protein n=1 Tax=Antribacter gilvus TaxID=2304675 RepID=UPI000F7B4A96|nr:hypothetical protein [Antribacter gilvus]